MAICAAEWLWPAPLGLGGIRFGSGISGEGTCGRGPRRSEPPIAVMSRFACYALSHGRRDTQVIWLTCVARCCVGLSGMRMYLLG